MLYKQRKALRSLEEREAAGESFWTDSFGDVIRAQMVHSIRAFSEQISYLFIARSLILLDEGLFTLSGQRSESADMVEFIKGCSDDLMPSVLEALSEAILSGTQAEEWLGSGYRRNLGPDLQREFEQTVNDLLKQHRISFEMISGEMIAKESQELHATVVEPVLTLLSKRPGWGDIETSYQQALKHLLAGDAGSAITSAGTALQDSFVRVGCKGNQLGDLIRDAKKRGFLSSHDAKLTGAIQDIAHWVSSDRSTMGNAHHASNATEADAWLTVHVVGALILRLSSESQRTP